jgi:pimeloyl-ACP methyl ester carboxylesterase
MTWLDDRPIPVVPGAEHRWVSVRGVQLHVAEFGQGPPVLLIHGLLQHWYAWRKLVPLLSGDHRLVCIDLRGFGWSEQTRCGYDLTSLGRDVIAMLDTLRLAQVDLVAHDFGACIAFRICLQAPRRVRNMIALNMTHPWPQTLHLVPNLWRLWFTALWEYPVVGRLALRHWPVLTRYLFRREVADPGTWSDPELDEFVEATRHSARAIQSVLWQYVRHDIPALAVSAQRHQSLSVPTLLLAGADDPVIPPSLLAGGEKHADNLTVSVIPNAGHYLHEEHPTVVARAVRDMVHTTSAPPALTSGQVLLDPGYGGEPRLQDELTEPARPTSPI